MPTAETERRSPAPVERLTPGDQSMLWPDDLGWPQDLGVIGVLDGRGLLDPSGRVWIEALRSSIESRLAALPRFRQRLHRPPFWLGGPIWVDAGRFDVADHVRVAELPHGAGESELLEACETIRDRDLDRSRPLWELWFLPGMADGRVGMFVRAHHTLADGAAGAAALGALFGLAPEALSSSASTWRPRPAPTRRALLTDAIRRLARAVRVAARRAAHPVRTLGRTREAVRAMRAILAEAKAPRTSFNRRIGGRRRLAVVHGDLGTVKEIARAHDATVNDVVLTAVAGGIAALLRSRGESIHGLVPRAVIPIAGRGTTATGNTTSSSLTVDLPIDDSDASRALRTIAGRTRQQKERPMDFAGSGILASPLLERIAVRFVARQRIANVSVSNVAGPPAPLYLGESRLDTLFPVIPLIGNLTVGVGALSYAGSFHLSVVADADTCPDHRAFASGVERTLDTLRSSLPTGGGA